MILKLFNWIRVKFNKRNDNFKDFDSDNPFLIL